MSLQYKQKYVLEDMYYIRYCKELLCAANQTYDRAIRKTD